MLLQLYDLKASALVYRGEADAHCKNIQFAHAHTFTHVRKIIHLTGCSGEYRLIVDSNQSSN